MDKCPHGVDIHPTAPPCRQCHPYEDATAVTICSICRQVIDHPELRGKSFIRKGQPNGIGFSFSAPRKTETIAWRVSLPRRLPRARSGRAIHTPGRQQPVVSTMPAKTMKPAQQAWLMKATGATYVAIAKALGVTSTTAQKYVHSIDRLISFQADQLQNAWFGPSPRVRFWNNFSGDDAACLTRGYSEPHPFAWPWRAPKPRSLWQRGELRFAYGASTPSSVRLIAKGPSYLGVGP